MEVIGVLKPSPTFPHPMGATPRAQGMGLLPIRDRESAGLGEAGRRQLSAPLKGTQLSEVWGPHGANVGGPGGRDTLLGDFQRRRHIFRSLRRTGRGRLLTGKSTSGSRSHPLCGLNTELLLTQTPNSECRGGHGGGFRQTQVLILALALAGCLILGKLFHSLRLSFFIYKMG